MKEIWDERYGKAEYAYGEEPNRYLEEHLQTMPVGNILFPAEGEGRNAVFAARLGWKVSAFDQSIAGQAKALALAAKHQVTIDYEVGEFQDIKYQPEQFDAIALIYAHFPADKKAEYNQQLAKYLKPGGTILFEAFSKRHLEYNSVNPKVGGPKEEGMLFFIEELKTYFHDFDIIELKEEEIELHEGSYHNGKGSVIRFIGKKK